MKVVLFCGGLGMRLRDYDENIPKPMVAIGYRPIIWHLMKYYAHYGHKDFIICLGYKAEVIKQYFLDYNECISNDFVFSQGGSKVELLHSDIHDWRITFVDTGVSTPIGERLRQVRSHLDGEEMFLANYSDCLTDLDLSEYVTRFTERPAVAGIVTINPRVTYHYIAATDGIVTGLSDVSGTPLRVNGGFFIFRRQIFDHLRSNEDLLDGCFRRLVQSRQLMAYEYDGFWKAMDTFKDKHELDLLHDAGRDPWMVWRE
jgi:glucose-1-phosphate cytidylyltransferase